jgi:hypothetical protein
MISLNLAAGDIFARSGARTSTDSRDCRNIGETHVAAGDDAVADQVGQAFFEIERFMHTAHVM